LAAFYLDHDTPLEMARLLRLDGHDVIAARDADLERAGDQLHLLLATKMNRVLVTHNGKDFLLLHEAWLLWTQSWQVGVEHVAVLVIPQPPIWSPARAAREVADLVQSGVAQTNQLYAWQPSLGWTRR
jgi:Domain of unknown function (DUF5615)